MLRFAGKPSVGCAIASLPQKGGGVRRLPQDATTEGFLLHRGWYPLRGETLTRFAGAPFCEREPKTTQKNSPRLESRGLNLWN